MPTERLAYEQRAVWRVSRDPTARPRPSLPRVHSRRTFISPFPLEPYTRRDAKGKGVTPAEVKSELRGSALLPEASSGIDGADLDRESSVEMTPVLLWPSPYDVRAARH